MSEAGVWSGVCRPQAQGECGVCYAGRRVGGGVLVWLVCGCAGPTMYYRCCMWGVCIISGPVLPDLSDAQVLSPPPSLLPLTGHVDHLRLHAALLDDLPDLSYSRHSGAFVTPPPPSPQDMYIISGSMLHILSCITHVFKTGSRVRVLSLSMGFRALLNRIRGGGGALSVDQMNE